MSLDALFPRSQCSGGAVKKAVFCLDNCRAANSACVRGGTDGTLGISNIREDETGNANVIVMPDIYEKYRKASIG
jgi:hypothetical protein